MPLDFAKIDAVIAKVEALVTPRASYADAEFNEADHPRDEGGRFGHGSGGPKIHTLAGLKKTGKALGTNPGGVYANDYGGKFYVKHSKSEVHARAEVLASRLYEEAGSPVIRSDLVDVGGGKIGTSSKWQKRERDIDPGLRADREEASQDFATHAWLANWDAAGLEYDNQVKIGGKLHTADVGGSLFHRAQGGGKHFGNTVPELETMRDKKMSPQAARIFSDLTSDQLRSSASKVAAIPTAKIIGLVNTYGPGDAKMKDRLAKTLVARRDYITNKFGLSGSIADAADPSGEALERLHELMAWTMVPDEERGVYADDANWDEGKHPRNAKGQFASSATPASKKGLADYQAGLGTKKGTVAGLLKNMIMSGKYSKEDMLAAAQEGYDLGDDKGWYPSWYKNDLKKKGMNPPPIPKESEKVEEPASEEPGEITPGISKPEDEPVKKEWPKTEGPAGGQLPYHLEPVMGGESFIQLEDAWPEMTVAEQDQALTQLHKLKDLQSKGAFNKLTDEQKAEALSHIQPIKHFGGLAFNELLAKTKEHYGAPKEKASKPPAAGLLAINKLGATGKMIAGDLVQNWSKMPEDVQAKVAVTLDLIKESTLVGSSQIGDVLKNIQPIGVKGYGLVQLDELVEQLKNAYGVGGEEKTEAKLPQQEAPTPAAPAPKPLGSQLPEKPSPSDLNQFFATAPVGKEIAPILDTMQQHWDKVIPENKAHIEEQFSKIGNAVKSPTVAEIKSNLSAVSPFGPSQGLAKQGADEVLQKLKTAFGIESEAPKKTPTPQVSNAYKPSTPVETKVFETAKQLPHSDVEMSYKGEGASGKIKSKFIANTETIDDHGYANVNAAYEGKPTHDNNMSTAVDKAMKDYSGHVWGKLTDAETSAVGSYKGSGYHAINEKLLSQPGAKSPKINAMRSAIDKSTIPADTPVWRGMNASLKDLSGFEDAEHSVGRLFEHKNFASCSRNKTTSEHFGGSGATMLKFTIPAGVKALVMKDQDSYEREIVLPDRAIFRIDKVEQAAGNYGKAKHVIHVTYLGTRDDKG